MRKAVWVTVTLCTLCLNLSAQLFFNRDSAFATGKDVVMLYSSARCQCTPSVISQLLKQTDYAIWWNQYKDRDPKLIGTIPKIQDSIVGTLIYSHYDFKYPFIAFINQTDTVFLLDTPNPDQNSCTKYRGSLLENELVKWKELAPNPVISTDINVYIYKITGQYVGFKKVKDLRERGLYIIIDPSQSPPRSYKYLK